MLEFERRFLEVKAINTKEYVIESARKDANGVPISEGRVVTAEANAKAAQGMMEVADTGRVSFCFAGGTLVHTDKGLVPIEQVRVGTRVLSQPELGGEQGHRPVINTVAFLDQSVHVVQVKAGESDPLITVIATPNHPFWVEAPLTEGGHWMAAEYLERGFVLQLADGRKATVHATGLVRRTQYADIACAADDKAGVGIVLDIGSKQIVLAGDDQSSKLEQLQLGDPYLTPVYNFEVEEFHTYYVADAGVWVHNANCPKQEALNALEAQRLAIADAMRNAELAGTCFAGDTAVHVETANAVGNKLMPIEAIEVGDRVLSRCEKTGEIAYKRVTKVFAHGFVPVYKISCKYGPEIDPDFGYLHGNIHVTGEHPFWVNEKGWVKVCDLQIGDVLLTCDGVYAELQFIEKIETYDCEVFNLEVEDFHTYFVHWSGLWVHNKTKLDVPGFLLGKVKNSFPKWTPLYKSTAELTKADGTPLNREAGIQLREQTLDRKLAAGEIKAIDDVQNAIFDKVEFQTACFPEDTLVLCEDGRYQKIFGLDIGDKVLSRCEATGEMACRRITKKYEHAGVKTMLVSFTPGAEFFTRFGKEVHTPIFTTPEHPFWVQGKGWVKAGELQHGDQFLTHDGVSATVDRVRNPYLIEPAVYNIEVEDFHTYFVDLIGIWVHNKNVNVEVEVEQINPSKTAKVEREPSPLDRSKEQLEKGPEANPDLKLAEIAVKLRELEATDAVKQELEQAAKAHWVQLMEGAQ